MFSAQGEAAPPTSPSHPQGAAELGLEKIPEPIKEATALFYGEEGPPQGPVTGWRVLASALGRPQPRDAARGLEQKRLLGC